MSYNKNDYTFLFIGGAHRSGTGMVRDIILKCPETTGFVDTPAIQDEGQFLQDVYALERKTGGPGKFAFHLDSHYTENHSTVSDENADKIFQQWVPYWDMNRSVLLEKTPSNMLKTRYLEALFPDSHFLMVFRHPVAVAYATKKWCRSPIGKIIDHTLTMYEIYRSDKEKLASIQEIKYEDIIENGPDGLFECINKLNIKLTRPALNYKIKENVNEKYFALFKKDYENVFSKYWQSLHNPLERFEERMNAFGYSMKDLVINK